MKKKTCFIVVLLLSVCLTYAQNNFEGFDGFPWNTTVSEFLKKFPEAKDSTDSDDKERNERVFQRSLLQFLCDRICLQTKPYLFR